MKAGFLLIVTAIITGTMSFNANAWWAGSWEDGKSNTNWNDRNGYYSKYGQSTPDRENRDNIRPEINYTQQQFEARQQYLNEIKEIQRQHQKQVEAAQKAYRERMKQWYKQ
ncbi:MAG: hypothetical protein KZQ64_01125 [gamma proteobacterium symbiont of Bathyaustriella thionipta]|nr:hypothetical protein [gamma proteobacterium symbiont of Bathyaustriella thionipta]MCU7950418.1 hypothetical protein [gamma proteobacterium symbiont of Bathyaustriella thionipta]MCU7952001.1 hypothetical protein [gamma proteobacterium symbiont of Bathyaustriella thionipta]MCU7957749.1 hypothetical protein [gamma proteobacterium symbiont of Bathyaustriella thionipta]MCU7967837.1 hypothetical protein [gamma proteobacterium symbiont of Bathyaustriella thionipta]